MSGCSAGRPCGRCRLRPIGEAKERPHGEFNRQFFLGDNLDATKLGADLDRGVLTLTIPVAEKSKPRRVEIGSAPRTVDVSSGSSGSESTEGNTQPTNA